MKPTEAQRRALEYVVSEGGEITLWPIRLSNKPVRDRCIENGWLVTDRPLPGSLMLRWRITDAGREAVS